MKPWSHSRSEYVSQMFGAIAGQYDVMNWIMTFGQDQRWRRQAADVANVFPGNIVLDVATGTGDLALELAERIAPGGHVTAVDFAEPMLVLAREKVARLRLPVSFQWGDALDLTFADDTFHAVTCGFGVRNFDDRQVGLQHMVRVTRPGGRVVVLELTPPRSALTRRYVEEVIPRLGQVIARAGEAYTYLPESIIEFPHAQALGHMLQAAGLRDVTYRLLNFGTVALHWGTKPDGAADRSR